MSTSSNGTSLQSPNRGIPALRKETPDTGPPRPPASNANRTDKPTNGPRRRILVIGAVIGVLGLFFGIRYWMYASTHEDTDDAYVTGYTHQISSRITGTIEEVLVDDNWHVTAGQPLLKLERFN